MNDNDELIANLRRYYTALGLKKVDSSVNRRLERERSRRIVSLIQDKCSFAFDHSSVLDVGSGWGEFLLTLKEVGTHKIRGVEPDPELVALSNRLLGSDAVQQGAAEALPFDSESFDLVICHDVIEHVVNCDIALAEMIRVVKTGGIIWLEFPNYAYPQESHYKTFFPPFASKPLGELYLRLIGRDPSFYRNNVRPTYYFRVMKILGLFDISWIDVHEELNGNVPSVGLKAILKRWYIHFSGPPVSSLLITKNGSGLRNTVIEFVKSNSP